MLSFWIPQREELLIVNGHLEMVNDITECSGELAALRDVLQVVGLLLRCHLNDCMLNHMDVVLTLVMVVHAVLLGHLVLVEAVLTAIIVMGFLRPANDRAFQEKWVKLEHAQSEEFGLELLSKFVDFLQVEAIVSRPRRLVVLVDLQYHDLFGWLEVVHFHLLAHHVDEALLYFANGRVIA